MKTRLALIPASREKLIRAICDHLVEPMSEAKELDAIADVLADTMDLLHRHDVGGVDDDLMTALKHLMRPVIQFGVIPADPKLRPKFVSVLIAMLASMSEWHYRLYLHGFSTEIDILDFHMEILMVFCDLVNKGDGNGGGGGGSGNHSGVFPKDWSQMLLFQNSVILKSLRLFSNTITQCFISPHAVERQLLLNFFHCAVRFLTHEQLQLETFSQNKRKRIISRYKDMRRDMAWEVRQMWHALGRNKKPFVPDLVCVFLEMNLIPQPEIR